MDLAWLSVGGRHDVIMCRLASACGEETDAGVQREFDDAVDAPLRTTGTLIADHLADMKTRSRKVEETTGARFLDLSLIHI